MNSEMDNVVVVSRLGKQFQRYHANKPWTLHEALVRGLERVRPFERFWALRDVSFSVRPGRMVGLIGSNGSGKSTLLRLISGVGRPEEGSIEVHRRMNALLDLGTGFHPDLTGRENAFVNGVIGGLTRREVAERLDSIVDFAGIEPFIDNPIRTYSSGMQMRLAFAIAIHTRPEMLLIDEILSVGDRAFQKKCFDRITEFKTGGCTILFVTHDTETVRSICDEVIWLDRGRLVAQGDPHEIVDRYIVATDGEKVTE
jgi:lipopolysaccharide transport system ATP-binding protein